MKKLSPRMLKTILIIISLLLSIYLKSSKVKGIVPQEILEMDPELIRNLRVYRGIPDVLSDIMLNWIIGIPRQLTYLLLTMLNIFTDFVKTNPIISILRNIVIQFLPLFILISSILVIFVGIRINLDQKKKSFAKGFLISILAFLLIAPITKTIENVTTKQINVNEVSIRELEERNFNSFVFDFNPESFGWSTNQKNLTNAIILERVIERNVFDSVVVNQNGKVVDTNEKLYVGPFGTLENKYFRYGFEFVPLFISVIILLITIFFIFKNIVLNYIYLMYSLFKMPFIFSTDITGVRTKQLFLDLAYHGLSFYIGLFSIELYKNLMGANYTNDSYKNLMIFSFSSAIIILFNQTILKKWRAKTNISEEFNKNIKNMRQSTKKFSPTNLNNQKNSAIGKGLATASNIPIIGGKARELDINRTNKINEKENAKLSKYQVKKAVKNKDMEALDKELLSKGKTPLSKIDNQKDLDKFVKENETYLKKTGLMKNNTSNSLISQKYGELNTEENYKQKIATKQEQIQGLVDKSLKTKMNIEKMEQTFKGNIDDLPKNTNYQKFKVEEKLLDRYINNETNKLNNMQKELKENQKKIQNKKEESIDTSSQIEKL